MADALTQLSSLSSDQAAYDRFVYFALRPELQHDVVADVKPAEQAMPGSSVVFTVYSELAAATTPLSETVDVDAVAMADSQVTVSLVEYGNAVLTTAKLRATSFSNVLQDAANLVGYNAGDTMDTIARNVLNAGANVTYGGDAVSRATLGAGGAADHMTGALGSKMVAILRRNNVLPHPKGAGAYVGLLHPDQGYDLRADTGVTGWTLPAAYAGRYELIANGEIGRFAGCVFIESPRVQKIGTGATASYLSTYVGAQALAKAYGMQDGYGPDPVGVMGNVVDKLKRLVPLGWKHLAGYAIFRAVAIQRLETTSSIAA